MSISNRLPDRTITNFEASDRYRAEVHSRIVGGAHTYSKGDDQFPALAPAAIKRGKHGRVWDLDGNEYVDCALALGAISLGHAYEPVLDAVREQLELGSAFQRPAEIELELANDLLPMLPGMERLKYAKNGSNVTTAAVKLSRAYTGRDLVAFPGNHPFYSFDDWFIGRTAVRSGVPETMRQVSVTYNSADPASLEKLFHDHPGQIACVITEPEDTFPNPPGVLQEIQAIARRHGAVFILDEMVTGFRAGLPGSYVAQGLTPDMTTWGKAIGNGFSFCALAGKAEIMDLGGIHQQDKPKVFLLSSTHGGEAHTLAAARAVLREYREKDVIGTQHALVVRVAEAMRKSLAAHRLEQTIDLVQVPWRLLLVFRDRDGAVSMPLRTLFLQEMLGHGILFQGVYLPCFTHTDADLAQIALAFDKACAVYAHALEHGTADLLIGDATRPVFRKYNGCLQSCPSDPCPNEGKCRGG